VQGVVVDSTMWVLHGVGGTVGVVSEVQDDVEVEDEWEPQWWQSVGFSGLTSLVH
jgi:hypothetical protein